MNILQNPFYQLKATPRDRKSRILELSEELALHGDQEVAASARSALTNPRNRLVAEIAWFPGLSPKRVDGLLDQLRHGQEPRVDDLPSLCAANLIAASLPLAAAQGADRLREAIELLASHVERFDADDVLLAVNEDRQASGLPPLMDAGTIEQELAERRRFYQREATALLEDLPTEEMVATYTALISNGTVDGEVEADHLVNDLLDVYETKAGGFLKQEAERIVGLIDDVEAASDRHVPAAQIRKGVEGIISALKTWDRIAQPIQLSSKAKGLDHDASVELAFHARGLAIHLFNEHDYLADSKLLSGALQELFAEVAVVNDKVQEDVETLSDIEDARQQTAAREKKSKEDFAREITYETTFGMIFKDKFSISPAGIEYRGHFAKLEAVTGVSWGSVRHSTNGIPTGTTYHVKWRDGGATTEIEPSERQFNEIVSRLWKGVCIKILFRMMETWRNGRSVTIGNVEVRDGGLVLTKPHVFSADEKRFFGWDEMARAASNGMLGFYGSTDRKFAAAFSYKETLNTHILEFATDRIWEGKAAKLSEIFENR